MTRDVICHANSVLMKLNFSNVDSLESTAALMYFNDRVIRHARF